MKALFKKMYLDEYDLRQVVKAVENLFDDYNYKKSISQEYIDASLHHELSDRPEYFNHNKKSDPTYMIVEKREKVINYLNQFDKKLNLVLDEMTADERSVFKYCVLDREQDKVIRDRICKSDKTFYAIKKSCYVKIALRFSLVDGFTKNVFATISLLD